MVALGELLLSLIDHQCSAVHFCTYYNLVESKSVQHIFSRMLLIWTEYFQENNTFATMWHGQLCNALQQKKRKKEKNSEE